MQTHVSVRDLKGLLQFAAEEGLIDWWSIEDDDVIVANGREVKKLSAYEAQAFLEALLRQVPTARRVR